MNLSFFLSHCVGFAWHVMFNPIVSSTMKSDLMTAEHICTVLTPWRGKTSPTKCPPLCCEKASALGHHKRAVTPICAPSASLAGKVYFQILATDSYVSNKNKPFLPGMLRLNHLSASIYSRPRALQLKSYLLNVLVEIMCGNETTPFFNRVSSPWQP